MPDQPKLFMRRGQLLSWLAQIGISESDVIKWTRAGLIETYHFHDHARAYYRRDQVEKFLELKK